MASLKSKVSKDELFDILFPRRTSWHHKQVLFPMWDLFVCISQILYEYCSTDIVPEVGFMIPVSVRAWLSLLSLTAAMLLLSLIAALGLILFSLFLLLQKLRFCSNPLLVLNTRWHMLWLIWVGLKVLICFNYLTWQLAFWIKSSLQFLVNIQRLDE